MSSHCPISGRPVARKNPPSGTVVLDEDGAEVRFCCPSHKVKYMKQNPDAREVKAEDVLAPSPVILVDLDETLIHSISWFRGDPILYKIQHIRELKLMRDFATAATLEQFVALMQSAPTIMLSGMKATVTVRPGVKAFLHTANEVGTVAVFTAASRDYAEAVLQATGLRKYIGPVFTTNDLPNPYDIVKGRPWVLVDDLQNIAKVRHMGNPPNGRILQVASFDEGEPNSPLPDPRTFFPRVER
jgi:hypothetical protein